jgi:hypothetical protein
MEKRELQEQLAQLAGLTKHPAWALVMKIAEEQLTGRIDNIMLNPVATVDATLQQEYLKGEVSGIKLFCRLPQILMDTLAADIEQLGDNDDSDSE